MSLATDDYAKLSITETLKTLQVDAEHGLSPDEVAKRQAQYGFNEIEEHEDPVWLRIFRRFWGPIPWMIETAAILSAIVQKWDDFSIIIIMLLVNAGLDFFQEHRALNALKALKSKLAREVTVRRGGEFVRILQRELVPGDIVRIKIGDVVPADVQLLEGEYLSVDQSALTGESLPVNKGIGEVAYANTIAKQGMMLAVVVNTAMATRFSTVVALVAKAQREERSHFQKMVIQIGNFLIMITLGLVLLIVMVSLFHHIPFLEIARFALVLTVAAIPVALPAVLSVTMAVGAMNLAKRQAIVSRLTAIEEFAGVDVFCTDKTGTLTRNEMEVAEPVLTEGHTLQELFLHAALASRHEDNDPIEQPIFEYLKDKLPEVDTTPYRQTRFVPFDPVIKRTEATIEAKLNGGSEGFVALKGAPQIIIAMAELEEVEARALNDKVQSLASKGYRTLAVARRVGEAPVQLLGLIPFYDPPRDDSRQVIDEMQSFGVEVKMVTGDNLAIAKEIGSILGLEQRTINSSQLRGSASSEVMQLAEVLTAAIYRQLKGEVGLKEAREFAASVMQSVNELYDTRLLEHEFVHTHESAIIEMIEEVDIFAEVVPEDKFNIVDTLQKGGHIVAMTGDGVNDAPALKRADCGFAVSNATDAARAAADIILTAPGLSVINEALQQARITFSRMKSYATFRITETIRIILFMTLSIVVFNFYPITPLMIILLALLNDIPILAIAYDNTKVHRRPVRWKMREMLVIASMVGLSGVTATFLLFFLLRQYGFSEPMIQTLIFLKLIIAGHSTIYITRSEGWFWQRPYPSALLMTATFGTEIVGTIIAAMGIMVAPIGWKYAALIWLYALAEFIVNDIVKNIAHRFLLPHEEAEGKAA